MVLLLGGRALLPLELLLLTGLGWCCSREETRASVERASAGVVAVVTAAVAFGV